MNILVNDPYTIKTDPSMPFLQNALCPSKIEQLFRQHLPQIIQNYDLNAIQIIRHKLGKRCIIQYDFKSKNKQISLIGKIRAKGTDFYSCKLQDTLWHSGFGDNSNDGISVPQPVGTIPELQMWLQRQVSGKTATHWLTTPQAIPLVKKIAQAAYKLNHSSIVPRRCHTIKNELEILHQRLPLVAKLYPHWQTRIEKLLKQCDHLGETIPSVPLKGIHRDFYPDQVIVNGKRLFIVDFDLYCQGDPSLDIGNFIGHITEYSLRVLGDPKKLKNLEIAMIEQFVKLSGKKTRVAIATYTTLTLVRHIYLSTQFPERLSFTETLLNLCEQRLSK